MNCVEFLQQTLRDAEEIWVSVKWDFDEQQADPFHHFWSSKKFLDAVKELIRQYKNEEV